MILRVAFSNLCQNKSKYNIKNTTKPDSLSSDTFQLQQKFNPAFGSLIPKSKVFKACDKLAKSIEHIPKNEDVTKIARDFYDEKLKKILITPSKYNEKEQDDFDIFRHGLLNIVHRKIFNEQVSKNMLLEFVDDIKYCVNDGIDMEKWKRELNKTVLFSTIFNKFTKDLKLMNSPKVSWVGKDLFVGKKVKYPSQLYNLASQPLLNAVKYSEEKPFKIVIEEIVKDGKRTYYASFINPETKPIPDLEIDKLLKGDGYRASNATDTGIEGTGLGISTVVSILKRNGYAEDIPNLFEKGREKGVCVRIPLIGLF